VFHAATVLVSHFANRSFGNKSSAGLRIVGADELAAVRGGDCWVNGMRECPGCPTIWPCQSCVEAIPGVQWKCEAQQQPRPSVCETQGPYSEAKAITDQFSGRTGKLETDPYTCVRLRYCSPNCMPVLGTPVCIQDVVWTDDNPVQPTITDTLDPFSLICFPGGQEH